MSASITILYPTPTDVEKFEQDYIEHLDVVAKNLPDLPKPEITRVKTHPSSPAPYYMIVTIPFESMEPLNETLKSEGMKVAGEHATQISSGGAPVFLVGTNEGN